jgi:hypothetical protein
MGDSHITPSPLSFGNHEDWSDVVVMHEKYESHRSVAFRLEDYKTEAQLLELYKSQEVVTAIITDKRSWHPLVGLCIVGFISVQ